MNKQQHMLRMLGTYKASKRHRTQADLHSLSRLMLRILCAYITRDKETSASLPTTNGPSRKINKTCEIITVPTSATTSRVHTIINPLYAVETSVSIFKTNYIFPCLHCRIHFNICSLETLQFFLFYLFFFF